MYVSLYLCTCVCKRACVCLQDTRFTITALSADRESNALQEVEEADVRLLTLKECRYSYCSVVIGLLLILFLPYYHPRTFLYFIHGIYFVRFLYLAPLSKRKFLLLAMKAAASYYPCGRIGLFSIRRTRIS